MAGRASGSGTRAFGSIDAGAKFSPALRRVAGTAKTNRQSFRTVSLENEGEVTSLKFSATGHNMGVAYSSGSVMMWDPVSNAGIAAVSALPHVPR